MQGHGRGDLGAQPVALWGRRPRLLGARVHQAPGLLDLGLQRVDGGRVVLAQPQRRSHLGCAAHQLRAEFPAALGEPPFAVCMQARRLSRRARRQGGFGAPITLAYKNNFDEARPKDLFLSESCLLLKGVSDQGRTMRAAHRLKQFLILRAEALQAAIIRQRCQHLYMSALIVTCHALFPACAENEVQLCLVQLKGSPGLLVNDSTPSPGRSPAGLAGQKFRPQSVCSNPTGLALVQLVNGFGRHRLSAVWLWSSTALPWLANQPCQRTGGVAALLRPCVAPQRGLWCKTQAVYTVQHIKRLLLQLREPGDVRHPLARTLPPALKYPTAIAVLLC